MDIKNPCGEIELPGSCGYCSGWGYSFVLTNKNKEILAYSEINETYYFTNSLSNEDCVICYKHENETISLFSSMMKIELYPTDYPIFNYQLIK